LTGVCMVAGETVTDPQFGRTVPRCKDHG
jgi:hypothetical protein